MDAVDLLLLSSCYLFLLFPVWRNWLAHILSLGERSCQTSHHISNSIFIDPIVGPSQWWHPFCGNNLISYWWMDSTSLMNFQSEGKTWLWEEAFGASVSVKWCLYCCSIVLILISTMRGHLIDLVVNLYREGGTFHHHNVPQSQWVKWHRNVINQSINQSRTFIETSVGAGERLPKSPPLMAELLLRRTYNNSYGALDICMAHNQIKCLKCYFKSGYQTVKIYKAIRQLSLALCCHWVAVLIFAARLHEFVPR